MRVEGDARREREERESAISAIRVLCMRRERWFRMYGVRSARRPIGSRVSLNYDLMPAE